MRLFALSILATQRRWRGSGGLYVLAQGLCQKLDAVEPVKGNIKDEAVGDAHWSSRRSLTIPKRAFFGSIPIGAYGVPRLWYLRSPIKRNL
jgi:hypothetical protein